MTQQQTRLVFRKRFRRGLIARKLRTLPSIPPTNSIVIWWQPRWRGSLFLRSRPTCRASSPGCYF